MSKKSIDLKCTSAFMASGKMITPGEVVKGVPASDAKSLIRRGKAKPLKSEAVEEGADTEAPALEDLAVDELKVTAEEYGIEGVAKMRKADLIAAIHAAETETK
jgi:hypothetical protein